MGHRARTRKMEIKAARKMATLKEEIKVLDEKNKEIEDRLSKVEKKE